MKRTERQLHNVSQITAYVMADARSYARQEGLYCKIIFDHFPTESCHQFCFHFMV